MKISDYTEEEKDAVIDRLDLGFMRNTIKSSDKDMLDLIKTFGGANAIFESRAKKLGMAMGESIHLPELRKRINKYFDS